MATYTMEFDDCAGYDCMYGGFVIRRVDKDDPWNRAVTVDLGDYGQKACMPITDEVKSKGEAVARTILNALNGAQPEAVTGWVPVDPPVGHTPHGKPGKPVFYWSEGQWYRFDTPPLPGPQKDNGHD